jgi:hypothetical protein
MIKNDFAQLDFITKTQPLTENVMRITEEGKNIEKLLMLI